MAPTWIGDSSIFLWRNYYISNNDYRWKIPTKYPGYHQHGIYVVKRIDVKQQFASESLTIEVFPTHAEVLPIYDRVSRQQNRIVKEIMVVGSNGLTCLFCEAAKHGDIDLYTLFSLKIISKYEPERQKIAENWDNGLDAIGIQCRNALLVKG